MALSDRAHYGAALDLLNKSVARAERSGQRRQAAWSLSLIGRVHLLRGELSLAASPLDESLSLVAAERWTAFQPWPEVLRAEASLQMGRPDQAAERLDHAFRLACRLGDPCWEAMGARVFAGLYFTAVDAAASGASVSRAWEPLFDARTRPKIAPIQFALAGMNAHINHDLCLALVATCREFGIDLDTGTPQHRDYLKVNRILERVESVVKLRFKQGLVGVADDALGRVDDLVAVWSVARARDAAWTQAQTLRALGRLPALQHDYLVTLGRIVGLAGRGLLIPTL